MLLKIVKRLAMQSSQSKRILCFIDSFNSGGAQKQMSLIADGFSDKGYFVETLQYHPYDFFAPKKVKQISLEK